MFKLNSNKLLSRLEIVVSVILAMTCVYSYFQAPYFVCILDKCINTMTKTISAMFPRLLAMTCFVSKIMVLIKNVTSIPKYKQRINDYEQYFPINETKKKSQRFFNISIIIANILITFPVHIIRLYLIHNRLDNINLTLMYAIMYIQNMSICSTEVYFIIRCFVLNQQFQLINDEMDDLKSETIIINKYPAVLQNEERSNHYIGMGSTEAFFSSNVHQLAGSIERLRMRHQFVRSIFSDLNELYSVQIGMSLSFLFLFTLFDMYGEVFNKNNKTNFKIIIYGWLLQYLFRFFAIVLTTHFTTKQVSDNIFKSYKYSMTKLISNNIFPSIANYIFIVGYSTSILKHYFTNNFNK